MTTHTYSSPLDHTSDAGFRAWGSGLSAGLSAAGLVQTADTGQINWVTVNRPGISTVAGYEIWRLADSSLYFKFEFGTGSAAAAHATFITVGQGSNGSGTVTGQLSSRVLWSSGSIATSAVTSYVTYISVIADSISITHKANSVGGNDAPAGYLCVGWAVNPDGTRNANSFAVLRCSNVSGVPTLQSVRVAATAQTYSDTGNFCVIPGNPSSSNVGADLQAYLCWMNSPDVRPFIWAAAYIRAEVTELGTFSFEPVGAVSHTYLAQGLLGAGSHINGQSGVTYSLAFIYE